jgi:hypothetical protein
MNSPIRVLVTGSRTWTDVDTIFGALDVIAERARAECVPGVVVVHGCAKGADMVADSWVRDRKWRGWPVEAERHAADWSTHGRRAGFVRNSAMVQRGADVCLAFILDASRGATQCADLAEAADIPTQRIERTSLAGAGVHRPTDHTTEEVTDV